MELFIKLIRATVAAVAAALLMPASPAYSAQGDEAVFAQLYARHCAACHGENGDGRSRAQAGLDPPPRDFTSEQAWYELSRERMIASVTQGRPGTAMVGWGSRLSEAQISGIVDYVRSSFMRPPAAAEANPGQQLYKRHCAPCHGDQGSGANWTKNSLNPAPRDFTAPAARAELSRERMITSVTYGRPGTAMMPFGSRLSEREVAQVVDYIRAEFIGAESAEAADDAPATVPSRTTAAAADMTAPLPHGLIGDAAAGQRFYSDNCSTCHGRRGDGEGPRSSFIKPPPRNFLASRSRRVLNRPALYRAIAGGKRGTVMPAWSTVLDEQQIADVAEYVFRSFIHPSATSSEQPEGKKKAVMN